MNDISLDRPPIVLRRPRGSGLYFLLAGVCGVLIGIGMFLIPLMLFEAVAVGVVGGVVSLVGFIEFTRSATLTVPLEGLGYAILGIHRSWA